MIINWEERYSPLFPFAVLKIVSLPSYFVLVKDNPYIPKEDKDFFILLRIGLLQKVEEELSPIPDWNYIYRLACEQTVQGIVADGLNLYHKQHPELSITQEQSDTFLVDCDEIIRQNYKVNQVLVKLCQLFENPTRLKELFPDSEIDDKDPVLTASAPITYVVMKGQTVAQYYPKPMLRVSGDIDFFFDDENYERAKALMTPQFVVTEEEQVKQKHIAFEVDNLVFEFHADEGANIGKREVFHQIKDEVLRSSDLPSYLCNGVTVKTAPLTFDISYVFFHILQHYYSTGISIRQICDLAMMLHTRHSDIIQEQLYSYLCNLGIIKHWQMFMTFVATYLGLPSGEALFLKLKKHPNAIWKACKKSGNFGQKAKADRQQYPHKESQVFIVRNFYRLIQTHRCFVRDSQFSLSFAIRNYFRAMTNYLKIARRKIL